MYLSWHDPFVVSGLAMLGLLIIVAIILLTITARRSADEVWQSVERKPKSKSQSTASTGTSDSDSLITPSQLESGSQAKQDDEQLPAPPTKAATKTVRFSNIIENHTPKAASKQGYESVPMRESIDLGTASSYRMSISQQQARELHFD